MPIALWQIHIPALLFAPGIRTGSAAKIQRNKTKQNAPQLQTQLE